MKKRLIGITLAAVMAFSLAACGGSSSSSSASGSGSASASNSTASGDSIVLTLNHDGATDHPYNYGCEKFADLVKEKTNGEVTVEVYPSSQIASGAKAVEFVQMQTLDMDLAATTSLINFAPIIGTLDMPFLFDNKRFSKFLTVTSEKNLKMRQKNRELKFFHGLTTALKMYQTL